MARYHHDKPMLDLHFHQCHSGIYTMPASSSSLEPIYQGRLLGMGRNASFRAICGWYVNFGAYVTCTLQLTKEQHSTFSLMQSWRLSQLASSIIWGWTLKSASVSLFCLALVSWLLFAGLSKRPISHPSAPALTWLGTPMISSFGPQTSSSSSSFAAHYPQSSRSGIVLYVRILGVEKRTDFRAETVKSKVILLPGLRRVARQPKIRILFFSNRSANLILLDTHVMPSQGKLTLKCQVSMARPNKMAGTLYDIFWKVFLY